MKKFIGGFIVFTLLFCIYRDRAFIAYPHQCNKCNYDKIINILEVHHIDCDRNNNKINNLRILCPTCHMEEHYITKTGKFTAKASEGSIPS